MNLAYVPCPKCDGTGYQHLIASLYRYPCRGCDGSGERPRIAYRILTALRHGAASREGY